MPPIITVSSRTFTRLLIGAALWIAAGFAIGAGLSYILH